MGDPFHLEYFAPTLAAYVRENLIGRLYTDEIKADTKKPVHVLSFGVYLDDLTGYEPILLGTFTSRYAKSEKLGQEFTSDCAVLFEQPVHLVYEKGTRTDLHTEIPFP